MKIYNLNFLKIFIIKFKKSNFYQKFIINKSFSI